MLESSIPTKRLSPALKVSEVGWAKLPTIQIRVGTKPVPTLRYSNGWLGRTLDPLGRLARLPMQIELGSDAAVKKIRVKRNRCEPIVIDKKADRLAGRSI